MSKVNVNPPDQDKAQEMVVPNETGEPNDVKDLTVFVSTCHTVVSFPDDVKIFVDCYHHYDLIRFYFRWKRCCNKW